MQCYCSFLAPLTHHSSKDSRYFRIGQLIQHVRPLGQHLSEPECSRYVLIDPYSNLFRQSLALLVCMSGSFGAFADEVLDVTFELAVSVRGKMK